MAAYQEAIKESDQSDFLTKAEVIRSVRDSSRAIANRLRTREQGTDDLVEKLEQYSQALHPEDWVERSRSVATWAAGIMGLTAGAMAGLVLDALAGLFLAGAFVGANLIRYLLAYPVLLGVGLRILDNAYNEYMQASRQPSQLSKARFILSKTVDPAEKEVYAVLGGSRPARTFERAEQGGALLIGVMFFVFALGVVWAILQIFSPTP